MRGEDKFDLILKTLTFSQQAGVHIESKAAAIRKRARGEAADLEATPWLSRYVRLPLPPRRSDSSRSALRNTPHRETSARRHDIRASRRPRPGGRCPAPP
eukprot:TRINITY_DN5806_c0_g1_i3.p3 TRINITY_DN5806_c0_g1~~TRINITY_DN5806_c0_g1_i3.p3  ORF type:complete len:100 (-),score=1.40 TRINITY_DN5806_c0_g1_i3:66-365(-)